MSAEHTPGPWVVDEYNDGDSRPSWRVVAPRLGSRARPWVATADGPANARLIAAAPTLLAELEHAARAVHVCHEHRYTIEPFSTCEYGLCVRYRAALAKAKGEARS